MYEPEYVYFENSFTESGPALSNDDGSTIACAYIDGFPADEDKGGCVICVVRLLPGQQFIVDWHHNGYRTNEDVLELIKETKEALIDSFCK